LLSAHSFPSGKNKKSELAISWPVAPSGVVLLLARGLMVILWCVSGDISIVFGGYVGEELKMFSEG